MRAARRVSRKAHIAQKQLVASCRSEPSTTAVLSPSPSVPAHSQTRPIVLLAVAGFTSQAMVRAVSKYQ
jgi:hypothetical protein